MAFDLIRVAITIASILADRQSRYHHKFIDPHQLPQPVDLNQTACSPKSLPHFGNQWAGIAQSSQ